MSDHTPTSTLRPVRLMAVILAVLSAAVVAVGCGGAATDAEVPTGDQAVDRAEALAEEVRQLQEEASEVGRRLVEDPEARAEAQAQAEQLEERARELAQQAETEAPEEPELRDAAQDVERATQELQEFAETEQTEALDAAREALNQADDELGSAAESLESRLGDEASDTLDDIRREVPELPRP
jgi:uncharacterized coiled-coil DUF342 family protein